MNTACAPAQKEVYKWNKDFYPTPEPLFEKMWEKIPEDDREGMVLEPSAGAGHILKYIHRKYWNWGPPKLSFHAIEKDPHLVDVLRGKNYTVVDFDFLTYCGQDKYDIIIGNPPFSEGDKHLLKAIEILYSGHIVFLLNAETLKNPHTNTRKQLKQKLDELNAEIEYISGAFLDAERTTAADVAIVHIHVDRKVEHDLFEGIDPADDPDPGEGHDPRELVEKESIENMVAAYNQDIEVCTRTLLDFYKNYFRIAPYLKINVEEWSQFGEKHAAPGTITPIMKNKLNDLLVQVRKKYWTRALELKAVRKRMTSKKQEEFYQRLKEYAKMNFTQANVRQFILNLIHSYEDILMDAVVEVFDKMTRKYAWGEDLENQNIHYFNGWKTNHAYRLNKKVILPIYCGSFDTGPFRNWNDSKWELSYSAIPELDDIDKVMNYFDDCQTYRSIADALNQAFEMGRNRNIKSTYFTISAFKKGTLHLTFRDEDILRRFNVAACRGKNWLFKDYGSRGYADLNPEERAVVNAFEDPIAYQAFVRSGAKLFNTKELLQIGYENHEN